MEAQTEKLLKRYGLKATPQRVIIVGEIYRAGHINIDKLYEKVHKRMPTVSLATVYKNINSMFEGGLLQELYPEGMKRMYEIDKDFHIHLICSSCGKVEDVPASPGDMMKFFSKYSGEKLEKIDVNLYYECCSAES